MKIKHFSGYGCVNAVKVKASKMNERIKQITIKVTGDHERGLLRNDTYDVFYWLVKRFCKDCATYSDILRFRTFETYENVNGVYVETCTYIIDYKVMEDQNT